MPADEELSDEISGLRNDLNRYHQETEARERVARQDRINIAVALGIASTFFAFVSSPRSPTHSISCLWNSGGFECVLYVHALIAIAYLPVKVAVINFTPILDGVEDDTSREIAIFERLNDRVLPSIYVFNFMGSAISGIGVLSGITLISLFETIYESVFVFLPSISVETGMMAFISLAPQSVIEASVTFAQTLLNVSPVTFILVEIACASAPAYYYSTNYSNTMQDIRASTSNTPIQVGSNQSGATPQIEISNPFQKTLTPDDLKIHLRPPDEISSNIPAAVGIDENSYHLGENLKPGDTVKLEVHTKLKPFREPPSEPIKVEIEYGPGSSVTEAIAANPD